MTSGSLPKAPKPKLVAYGKGARDSKPGRTQQPTSLSQCTPDLYDFPDSDEFTPPSPPSTRPAPPAKTPVHSRGASSKPAHSEGRPVKPSPGDNRKRKHSKAFEMRPTAKAPQDSRVRAPPYATGEPSRPVSAKIPTSASPMARAAAPTKETNEDKHSGHRAASSQSPTLPITTIRTYTPKSKLSTPFKTSLPTNSHFPTSTQRKSRLIDRLASQRAQSPGSETDCSSASRSTLRSPTSIDKVSTSQTIVTDAQQSGLDQHEGWSRPTYGQTGSATSKKVRHTYSQARSIRDDSQSQSDNPFGLADDLAVDTLVSSPPPKVDLDEFDIGDDDDDEPKIAIKSVHELRRAGVNNRFADEMEDLLSRIGAPRTTGLSMRRNALLELGQKLQRKDFASQFRDHAARDNVARKIGLERDIISGFALAASLVLFLSTHNAPGLLRHLMEEKIGRFLYHLLRNSDDIEEIAKERQSNLSKSGRTSVNSIKTSLLALDIWHGYHNTVLSPRSVVLELCCILQSNVEARFRAELTQYMRDDVLDIVETHIEIGKAPDLDFTLAVLIMESDSGATITSASHQQMTRVSAVSAKILQMTLVSWPRGSEELDSAALKLAINTTNTDSGSESFGGTELFDAIAQRISTGLREVQAATEKNTLDASLYDGLLLILGIAINVLEHFPPARTSLNDSRLDLLADLFLEKSEVTEDARSVEASKVSIAFGYLAVILGYLCLDKRGRAAIERSRPSSLRQVVDSIREFIGVYRNVDSKVHELETLAQELRRHTK